MNNSKVGLVLKVERSSAVVLTPSGEFKRIAIRGRPPRIGEEIPIDCRRGGTPGWFWEMAWAGARSNLLVACLIFLLVLVAGGYVGRNLLFQPGREPVSKSEGTQADAPEDALVDTPKPAKSVPDKGSSSSSVTVAHPAGIGTGGPGAISKASSGLSVKTPEPRARVYVKGIGGGGATSAQDSRPPVTPTVDGTIADGSAGGGDVGASAVTMAQDAPSTQGTMLAMARSVTGAAADVTGTSVNVEPQSAEPAAAKPQDASVRIMPQGKAAAFVPQDANSAVSTEEPDGKDKDKKDKGEAAQGQ